MRTDVEVVHKSRGRVRFFLSARFCTPKFMGLMKTALEETLKDDIRRVDICPSLGSLFVEHRCDESVYTRIIAVFEAVGLTVSIKGFRLQKRTELTLRDFVSMLASQAVGILLDTIGLGWLQYTYRLLRLGYYVLHVVEDGKLDDSDWPTLLMMLIDLIILDPVTHGLVASVA